MKISVTNFSNKLTEASHELRNQESLPILPISFGGDVSLFACILLACAAQPHMYSNCSSAK